MAKHPLSKREDERQLTRRALIKWSVAAGAATGSSVTAVWLNTNGATPYYPNVIQIDGSTVTPFEETVVVRPAPLVVRTVSSVAFSIT